MPLKIDWRDPIQFIGTERTQMQARTQFGASQTAAAPDPPQWTFDMTLGEIARTRMFGFAPCGGTDVEDSKIIERRSGLYAERPYG